MVPPSKDDNLEPQVLEPIPQLHELPPHVKYFLDGTKLSIENLGLVSALFAGVAAQLYGLLKSQESYSEGTSDATKDSILGLCYGAIFLNLGATMLGMAIANRIAGVQLRKRTSTSSLVADEGRNVNRLYFFLGLSESQILLEKYSEGAVTKAVMLHWALTSSVGAWCLIFMIIIYANSEERKPVKIAAFVFMAFILLPHFGHVIVILWRQKLTIRNKKEEGGEEWRETTMTLGLLRAP
ncbi:hypothetical protein FA13DRAFT_1820242 [Coprinellus micaceus]|uniref:Uncharacterized protein n=1 Tax=Coprinellus micaceus TaxID=71717 RepID=A0A4Y7SFI0_COPMI|nr:hypothetical protein FA13DRAFT_1820242 [Coprinellus micaceus]